MRGGGLGQREGRGDAVQPRPSRSQRVMSSIACRRAAAGALFSTTPRRLTFFRISVPETGIGGRRPAAAGIADDAAVQRHHRGPQRDIAGDIDLDDAVDAARRSPP